tara:strand:- start:814 stop:1842 length:1029 start_codon:yes stop_codon:yes gene_type:complete
MDDLNGRPGALVDLARIPARTIENSNAEDAGLFRAAIESELMRLAETTRANYGVGLRRFSEWLRDQSCSDKDAEPLPFLLSAGAAKANAIVSQYLVSLGEQGLAPGTVALRLAPLKWGITLARKMGLTNWEIFVKGPAVVAYRDVRGHKPEDTQKMFVGIKGTTEIDLRDKALVLLLACLAFRRSEITSLRICDYDSDEQTVLVQGKGRLERTRSSLPTQVAIAIDAYLLTRGDDFGAESALFAAYSRSQAPGRALTANALYRRVKTLAKRGGVEGRVTPHGFRHCAITQALNALDGDIRRVSSFARHAKIQTTTIYDDERRDLAGGVAEVLAALVSPSENL